MIDPLKQNEQQGDALFQQTTEVGPELLPELPAAGAGDGGARAARLRSAGRPWLSCIGLPPYEWYQSWGQVTVGQPPREGYSYEDDEIE